MWPQGKPVAVAIGVCALALGACRGADDDTDALAAVLRREQAQALAAARIGPGGGTLEVATGDLAGAALVVPPGAVGADAVFSIYAGDLGEESGYDPVGPAAEFRATVTKLNLDATVVVPFVAEAITTGTPKQRVLVLYAADGQTAPVPGVSVGKATASAPTKIFGHFGAVIDPAWAQTKSNTGTLRCPTMANGTTLKTAISGTRYLALANLTDATVMTARSYDANGCGVSPGWEVVWYSSWQVQREVWSYWATGATLLQTINSLPCAPQGYNGAADSTTLSDDFAARWGATPQSLLVEVRNCDATPAQVPPRVRLTAGAGNWVEYDEAGAFVGQNF